MPSPLLPNFIEALKSAKAGAGLNEAIALSALAHAGQVDKGGAAYISHPLRVMLEQTDEMAMTTAVLHDVLEDIPNITLQDLWEMGFSEEVLNALTLLTKKSGEEYDTFIRRIAHAKNHAATAVKIADLVDNSDLRRIPNPTEKDRARVAKYKAALLSLGLSPCWTQTPEVDSTRDELSQEISFVKVPQFAGYDRRVMVVTLFEAKKGYEGAREALASLLGETESPLVFLPRELRALSSILTQPNRPHRPRFAPSTKSLEAIRAAHLYEILRAASGLVVFKGRTVAQRAHRDTERSVSEVCCDMLGCADEKWKHLVARSKRKRHKRRDIVPQRIKEHFKKHKGYCLPPSADKFFDYCLDNDLL